MLLKPMFDIIGRIVIALTSLLSQLLIAAIRVLGGVLLSGTKFRAEALRSASVTQNER